MISRFCHSVVHLCMGQLIPIHSSERKKRNMILSIFFSIFMLAPLSVKSDTECILNDCKCERKSITCEGVEDEHVEFTFMEMHFVETLTISVNQSNLLGQLCHLFPRIEDIYYQGPECPNKKQLPCGDVHCK